MKRLFYFLGLSFILLTEAQAQLEINGSTEWSNGEIILHSNDTVNCRLRYNQILSEGVLQVLDRETILTLSVKDVKAFSFFDEKKNCNRSFYTLSLQDDGTIKSHDFFLEHLYSDDHFFILNHNTIGLAYDYMEYTPFKRKTSINKKYLLDLHSGKLLPLSKKNVLHLLQDRKKLIASYIEDNSLKLKKVSDYINLFQYYRSL
jgi:hypothetical protein